MIDLRTAPKVIGDSVSVAVDWLKLARTGTSRQSQRAPGKHLALLAWALPPSTNAGVYRPLSFLRYGPDSGWRISAFHGAIPQDQRQHGAELLAKIPVAVALHTVAESGRQPAWRAFPRIDGGFVDAVDFASHCIRALADEPPDVVCASGPPFCLFVAGLFVARHFGAKLVLDYRDEWTQCPFDFVSAGADDVQWERKCLAHASAVLFTTESHRRHQLATFAELDAERTHLVPNGWDPEDFAPAAGVQEAADPTVAGDSSGLAPVTIAHVGNLASHTPPDEFLAAAQGLMQQSPQWRDRLRINLVGRRSKQAQQAAETFQFPAQLEVLDHVGKREANRRMQACSVLLLIAVPDLQRYLPGKLFDYIAAARPILVYGAAGEASALVQQLGIGVLCSPESGQAGLQMAIDSLLQLDMGKTRPTVQAWLQTTRREALARRAFAIFDALRSPGPAS